MLVDSKTITKLRSFLTPQFVPKPCSSRRDLRNRFKTDLRQFGWFFSLQEVQILKALILGEEERGQSQYQVVCMIFHFDKNSFISSDAMSKLRQKNPSTIRTPEEDLGRTNYTMDYTVVLPHSGLISPHISELCAEAGEATYTRHADLVLWAASQGNSSKLSAAHKSSTHKIILGTCRNV